MGSFPFLPMAVLVVSLFSAWFVELSLTSYVGYMVLHLGIVDDKDESGELVFRNFDHEVDSTFTATFSSNQNLLCCFPIFRTSLWGLENDCHLSEIPVTEVGGAGRSGKGAGYPALGRTHINLDHFEPSVKLEVFMSIEKRFSKT